MIKVRTRYAPSPTGYFHIGGARTALFNYLYTKHYSGEFIVRIEDTDVARNVEGGIESQLENLKWLGIFADESVANPTENGPYIQSQKFDVYKRLAFSLLEQKLAYRCFCTPEELEQARESALARGETPKYSKKCLVLTESEINEKLSSNTPFAIRLSIKADRNFEWNDLVRGLMSVSSSSMTDPIILKNNGIATYNFAVVIDDHDMQITHILRGEEHLSNTPYQIAIKEALGYKDNFSYGHLSIIVDASGKKLSKRNLDVEQFLEEFKTKGYLPEALVNFIALLGWSDEENKEILNMRELIKKFSIDRLTSAPAFFDINKLNWVSSEYFKKMDDVAYTLFVVPFIKNSNPILVGKEKELALLFKKNLFYAQQINEFINTNFPSELGWEHLKPETKEIILKNNKVKDVLSEFKYAITHLSEFNDVNVKDTIKKVGEKVEASGKELFMPIRIALTGQEHGPELASIITLYGQTKVNEIVDKFLSNL